MLRNGRFIDADDNSWHLSSYRRASNLSRISSISARAAAAGRARGPHSGGPWSRVAAQARSAAHDDDRAPRVVRAVLADRTEQGLGERAVTPAADHEQLGGRR